MFYALGGDDTVRGLGGDDRIFDGKGIDRFEGGEGGDRILSPATRATTFSWRATAAARRSGAARASTEPGPEASDRPFGVERAIR